MAANFKALILKDLDYKESDKIVTVLTETEGKMAVVARGVKKVKSSLRGCVQPFCYSELQIHQGRSNMGTVTQGKILDFFGNAREDIALAMQCMHIMELLDKSQPEHHSEPGLFELSLRVLNLLNSGKFRPLWIRYYELALIRTLGVAPVLDSCVHCGRADLRSGHMSLEQGGLLCQSCSQQQHGLIPLRVEPLALMKHLDSRVPGDLEVLGRMEPSDRALADLEICLERYIEHQIEKPLMVKKNIRLLR